MAKLSAENRAAIEEVATGRSNLLDLSDAGLDRVPEEVRELVHLRGLDLAGNAITALPSWMGELQALTKLELRDNGLTRLHGSVSDIGSLVELSLGYVDDGNPLEGFPPLLRRMTQLEYLRLDGCRLTDVPDWIGELVQLVHLELNSNDLRTLPGSIAGLVSLRLLDVGRNRLSTLPPLDGLLNLRALRINGNRLRRIPSGVRSMPHLRILHAGTNNIGLLPAWVGELTELTAIELIGNELRTVPPALARLERLDALHLQDNPLESPPVEVAEQGIGAIRAYFEQLEEQGASQLYEAKLLIVGEPGAGKTSLATKLIDPRADLPAEEDTTRGIDVVPWRFQTPEGKDVTVSIWDFGGQQIYHATHQFFLTHRSTYALVCNERKEDTDFDYWLDVTQRLGGGSPLLIVNNEVHGKLRALNGTGYRKAYGHLRDILPVDLLTGAGLDAVAEALRRAVLGLEHIGITLPAGWLRIRRALTDLRAAGRDHIPWAEFATICAEAGLDDRTEQRQVAQYLHDLGVCLHFQDDDQLSKTVILNPTWGTDAVYRVLDDKATTARWGEFGSDDLTRLWHEERYADMRFDLLRLMLRFRLCYQIPDTTMYLAPQLLSPEPPAYEWDPTGASFVRYEYDFMPKGVMTQLIVRLHHLIRDGSTMWRNGVVLDRGDDTAEVVESYHARRIDIRVKGPNARGLTAILVDTIDRINQVFDGTGARIRIPCICAECAASDDPHLHDADELRRLRAKKATRECGKSAEDVRIDRLLDAIGPAERPSAYFVSYKRPGSTEPGGESALVVDELQAALATVGRRLLRDDEVIGYGESIGAFMDRLGAGDAVVIVLSDAYLRSAHTMGELLSISQRRTFAQLIRLIVMPDAQGIYDAVGRAGYLAFWDEKVEQLRRLAATRPQRGFDLQDDLSLHEGIRNAIHEVLPVLADQNARDLEWHRANRYADIVALLGHIA